MKNYIDFPQKKTFIYELKKQNGEVIHTIKYEQATIDEWIEFQNMSQDEQVKACYDIVFGGIEHTWWEKLRKKFNDNYYNKLERILYFDLFFDEEKLNEVLDMFISTRYRRVDSIYKDIKKKKEEERFNIYSAEVKSICKEYNIAGPLELFANYTLQQYQWLVDGLIFSGYELDDEGKEINDKVTGYQEHSVEKAKQSANSIREQFERVGMKF